MILCESLLRTTDLETRDELIKEKLSGAEWNQITENSIWARISGAALTQAQKFAEYNNMVTRLGWPTVRKLVIEMVKVMGNAYVMGETITRAMGKKEAKIFLLI